MPQPDLRPPARGGRLPAVLTAFLLALSFPSAASAASAPMPSCAGPAAVPAVPAPGAPPVIMAWHGELLDRAAPAPPCLGWPDFDFSILLAMAGRFRHPGGVEAMLEDFGRVSSMTGLRYWSISDRRWQVLVERSEAVTDASARQVRADFAPAELQAGRDLYIRQRENRGSQAIVYRLHVLSRSADGFAVDVTNVSSIHFLFFRLFAPGDLRSAYFFRRVAGDDWAYWAVGGTHLGLTGLFGPHIGSFENRAMALYRHFAGIPDDQEPPAATEE